MIQTVEIPRPPWTFIPIATARHAFAENSSQFLAKPADDGVPGPTLNVAVVSCTPQTDVHETMTSATIPCRYMRVVTMRPDVEAMDIGSVNVQLRHIASAINSLCLAHEKIASKAGEAAQEGSDLGLLQKLTAACVQSLNGHLAQLSNFVGSGGVDNGSRYTNIEQRSQTIFAIAVSGTCVQASAVTCAAYCQKQNNLHRGNRYSLRGNLGQSRIGIPSGCIYGACMYVWRSIRSEVKPESRV